MDSSSVHVGYREEGVKGDGASGKSAPPSVAQEVLAILNNFEGESSCRRLFWEVLSYDRVREPLPYSFLPSALSERLTHLEVFAESRAFTVIYAITGSTLASRRVEQLAWNLKRRVPNCVILLQDQSKWVTVYPDESTRPLVRVLPIPGPPHERHLTARSITALSAADPLSDEEFDAFEVAEQLDIFFPGALPRLNELFEDAEQTLLSLGSDLQSLFPSIMEMRKRPLLTPEQERGEDITIEMKPPDGSSLTFHQWRLVMNNLRLVVWIARGIPRVGMELADLVQEGVIGLMTAARRYDPKRRIRFSTYAFYWIRQRMFREFQYNWNLIRWPIWKASDLIDANLKNNDEGFPPGFRTVVYTPRRLDYISLQTKDPLSLLIESERNATVSKTLNRLGSRKREVIARRFGIGFEEEQTFEEIGQRLGLTRERVRQLECSALDKLVLQEAKPLLPYRENARGEPPRARAAKIRRELKRGALGWLARGLE